MPSGANNHRPDVPSVPDQPRPSHEPVPGPFGHGQDEAGGPYEWLTPQRSHPKPLRHDFAPERAAS